MHIIVEGPDGSGKTTMVNDLVRTWNLTVHARPCTSDGGIIDPSTLDQWVMTDLDTMIHSPRCIYDRHPVISEPVYGPIIRHTMPGEFGQPSWLRQQRDRLSRAALVVWCLPPWFDVYRNIKATSDTQMPGVAQHAYQIYTRYWQAYRAWPGPTVLHDYTTGLHRRGMTIQRIGQMSGVL